MLHVLAPIIYINISVAVNHAAYYAAYIPALYQNTDFKIVYLLIIL